MTSQRARVVASGSLILTFVSFGAAIFLLATGVTPLDTVSGDILYVSLILFWGLLGTVLAVRVPTNPIGWIFCALATIAACSFFAQTYGHGSDLPARAYVAWFDSWAGNWIPPVLVILSLILFPTGRLTSNFDRALAWITVAVCGIATIGLMVAPGDLARHPLSNPFGIEALDGVTTGLINATGPVTSFAFIGAIVSMFFRLRSSRGVQRQQLKYFFLAAAVLTFDIVLGSIAAALGVETGVGNAIGAILFALGFGGLAVAITFAILRYRLYDIDRLINRALVYGAMTALLVAAYLVLVVGINAVIRPFVADSDLAVAASTLAVAALFRPLRTRVQGFIDKRFYRRKYDASQTLASLSAHLRNEVEIDSVRAEVLTAVRDTVQPVHASLWLRGTQ